MTGYRYPKIWNADQERLLEIWMAQGMKRQGATRRLREVEARGYTAADILNQMPLPFEEPTCTN